jgi:methylated-DNA-protein-cysteine methyltransferase-like protein
VPKGRVTSYGAIAAALGTKLSARMVGWAMNGSHRIKPKVPAHRVVNRQGLLTGRIHFDDPDQMQQLLEKEGVIVKENQIQDFEKIFWDPVKELGF